MGGCDVDGRAVGGGGWCGWGGRSNNDGGTEPAHVGYICIFSISPTTTKLIGSQLGNMATVVETTTT